jgi:hypothetical protein
MNRTSRDYCNKNYHPNWKAWTYQYGHPSQQGAYCIFCEKKLTRDYIGSGNPEVRAFKRKEFFGRKS